MSEQQSAVPTMQQLEEARPNGQTPALGERVRSLRLGTSPSTSQGSGRTNVLAWGLAGIFFCAASAFGFLAYTRTPSDQTTATGQGTDPAAAGSASVSTQSSAASGDVLLQAKGYVIAAHRITISPKVGGDIIWLDPRFKEGSRYNKGDRLAEIKPEVDYQAQLRSTERQLRSAEAMLVKARRNLVVAQTGSLIPQINQAKADVQTLMQKLELSFVDRNNKESAGNATARDDMQKAVIQVKADEAAHISAQKKLEMLETVREESIDLAKADVDKAKADVGKAEADVEAAQTLVKNCTLFAPVTGYILVKNAEQGGYVNALAYTGIAGSLCDMADLSDLEVSVDVQERDIARITVGGPCYVMPDAFAGNDEFKAKHPRGYEGVYDRRMPVADRSKGSIQVRVKVRVPEDEVAKYLLPDMGAIVTFRKSSSAK